MTSNRRSTAVERAVTTFFRAPFRARTYKRLGYLLLAFPLGLVYFVGLAVGGSVGVGLAVTWLGVPILLATLLAATAVAGWEAKLATLLVDYEVSVPPALRGGLRREDDGVLDTLRRFLAEPTTWTSLGLGIARFAFGLVAFVVTVTAAAVLVALLAAPFVYNDPGAAVTIGSHAVDTLPEALGVAGVGVLWLFVAANLVDLLASAGARLTGAFLAPGSESARETVHRR